MIYNMFSYLLSTSAGKLVESVVWSVYKVLCRYWYGKTELQRITQTQLHSSAMSGELIQVALCLCVTVSLSLCLSVTVSLSLCDCLSVSLSALYRFAYILTLYIYVILLPLHSLSSFSNVITCIYFPFPQTIFVNSCCVQIHRHLQTINFSAHTDPDLTYTHRC
jgi:hypothetical protein